MKIEMSKRDGSNLVIIKTDKISINGNDFKEIKDLEPEEIFKTESSNMDPSGCYHFRLIFNHNLKGDKLKKIRALMCERDNLLRLVDFEIYSLQLFIDNNIVIFDTTLIMILPFIKIDHNPEISTEKKINIVIINK